MESNLSNPLKDIQISHPLPTSKAIYWFETIIQKLDGLEVKLLATFCFLIFDHEKSFRSMTMCPPYSLLGVEIEFGGRFSLDLLA